MFRCRIGISAVSIVRRDGVVAPGADHVSRPHPPRSADGSSPANFPIWVVAGVVPGTSSIPLTHLMQQL